MRETGSTSTGIDRQTEHTVRRRWRVGLAALVVALAACRPDQTRAQPECPDGSSRDGDRCVATIPIASTGGATPPSATPPIASVGPLTFDAGDGLHFATGAPLGVVLEYCRGLFVLVRPARADAATPENGEAAHAELRRAIAAGDPAVHRCVGEVRGFIPLARGKYVVIIGYDDELPSNHGKGKTFPYAAFGRLVDIDKLPVTVMVTGYSFGGSSHCPFAEFLGQAPDAPLVLLEHRAGLHLAGTDRVRFANVRVRGGRVALRIFEVEDEIAHLDRLALEIDGRPLLQESRGSLRPLDRIDGVSLDVPNGRELVLWFRAPWLADATADIDVVASGFYVPLAAPQP